MRSAYGGAAITTAIMPVRWLAAALAVRAAAAAAVQPRQHARTPPVYYFF